MLGASPHHVDASGKYEDTGREDEAVAEHVTERTAEQQESREDQRIRLDDPLRVGDGGVQRGLQRREGDVDGRPVDERETRAEYCGGENPLAGGSWRSRLSSWTKPHRGLAFLQATRTGAPR